MTTLPTPALPTPALQQWLLDHELVNRIHVCDALDLCAMLPDQSVDLLLKISHIHATIPVVYSLQTGCKMDEQEVIRLYVVEGYTLRRIADAFETNHHMVHRILERNGIEITQRGRKRKPFTDDHRRKISAAGKGRKSWSAGKKMTETSRRANMRGKLGTAIDLGKYPDYERLLFLTKFLSKRREHIGYADSVREPFLDKFYFDAQFNAIYDAWIASGKNRWYRPTLDHKQSQSHGGSWKLDNLQFLTWFENRAKADMNDDEWIGFCRMTHTRSNLFIRVDND